MSPLTPYLWAIKLGAAALLVVGIVGGVWYYGHRRYDAGYSAASIRILAADRKAADIASAQYAKQEAAWTAPLPRATDASIRKNSMAYSLTMCALAASGCATPPDISGVLESYAEAADRLSAQLRALIDVEK
jgi:hypothetical protein